MAQHILRASSGLDCYKLRKTNHLCNNILHKKITKLSDAIVKVQDRPPPHTYPSSTPCPLPLCHSFAPPPYPASDGACVSGLCPHQLDRIIAEPQLYSWKMTVSR